MYQTDLICKKKNKELHSLIETIFKLVLHLKNFLIFDYSFNLIQTMNPKDIDSDRE